MPAAIPVAPGDHAANLTSSSAAVTPGCAVALGDGARNPLSFAEHSGARLAALAASIPNECRRCRVLRRTQEPPRDLQICPRDASDRAPVRGRFFAATDGGLPSSALPVIAFAAPRDERLRSRW